MMMAEPASAAPHRAAVDYCVAYGHGGTDRSFTSKAQCEESASGLTAECYRNAYGKEGELFSGSPAEPRRSRLGRSGWFCPT
jgi:Protein of unknown function (DUF3551)